MRYLQLFLLSALMFSPAGAAEQDRATAQINSFLESHWTELKISPAEPASESDYIRRIYLDLVGRIPTRLERKNYLADQRTDKQEHLVDHLLNSEDHVQHLTDIFDTLLMGRGSNHDYRERQNHQWRTWLEGEFRENRPWNEIVAKILMARPKSQDERGLVWFLYERKDNAQQIAEAIAPAFFGIRIDCAQCHDHFIATEIEQAHYWGLVAFFNRSKNTNTPNGPRVSESAIGGYTEFANLEGGSTPNYLTFFQSTTVDEARPEKDQKQEDMAELYRNPIQPGSPRVPQFSRREKFVEKIVKQHPLIARAFVNRIWAMLLGRGIVHPFDEMDSVHPPSHPELLDWLAEDFRQSGYNIRRLTRNIVLCRAYQLDSRQPSGIDDPATFAWYLERPLTAEQLARSMQLAVQGSFRNDHPLFEQLRKPLPEVLPETISTGIAEALFYSNNPAVNEFLKNSSGPESLISQVMKLDSSIDQVNLLCETVYGRSAGQDEMEQVAAYLKSTPSDSVRQRWEQILWALLTNAEFHFNH